MNYENQPCPYCEKPLREGEDIVVCPVCATPQHRDCWMENGRCANDDLHASGFVWEESAKKSAPQEDTDTKICPICKSENPKDALHCGNCGGLFGKQEEGSKKCRFCGKENADDALHCNQCGAPLTAAHQGAFYYPPHVIGTDIPSDEKIGENTAEDLALYVRASAGRYIKKFKKFENGKKLSFNWAAFFFAPYWFFYRKLYKAGAFLLVVFVTASMLLSGYSNVIYEAATEYTDAIYAFDVENATEEELAAFENEALRMMDEFYAKVKKPMLITAAVTAVLRLICALAADKLYYKKILSNLKIIKEEIRDIPLQKMTIASKGGLSALAFTASLLGENILISVLVYAADMIKNII